MGKLTTHVLDTARGRPGAGVEVSLHALAPEGRRLVARTVTDDDGRSPEPLLGGDAWQPGTYELEFAVGEYFRATGVELADPPFLDRVVVRVSLSGDQHYHVPLLVSPWSYATYRGS